MLDRLTIEDFENRTCQIHPVVDSSYVICPPSISCSMRVCPLNSDLLAHSELTGGIYPLAQSHKSAELGLGEIGW